MIKNLAEGLHYLVEQPSGGMLVFRSNTSTLKIKVKLGHTFNMSHMPFTGQGGCDVYIGKDFKSLTYFRTASYHYSLKEYEFTFFTNWPKEDRLYLINLPLYGGIEEIEVGIDLDATINKGEELFTKGKIVCYGTSITQGGCASHPGNAYANILSRRFDADFINLGFSSGGKAEVEMAEYIGGLDMSFLLYDYDHNASTAEYLKETHERMFKIIRKMQPNLPIIMASAADEKYGCNDARTNTIIETYENAIAAGDENVYFINGRTIYAPVGRGFCTVDDIHPNDLGFYMMANAFSEVIQKVLDKNLKMEERN